MKHGNLIMYGFVALAAVILALVGNWKVGILFFGLFHLFMWINVTVTGLCNALVARVEQTNNSFYRLLCIIIAALCFALIMI